MFGKKKDLTLTRNAGGGYSGRERSGTRHLKATLTPLEDGQWKLDLGHTIQCGRNATWSQLSAVVRQ